ncbi:MAG: PAS domain-containing protein [Acidobacteria bacterium]|nr:PAS domain-containing protein [Acidobacteriota bacterium]
MELEGHESVEEIKRLRRCLNDLVSVLALPAIWTGGEASDIYRTLLDTLRRMLSLDFVYVRAEESPGEQIEFTGLSELLKSRIESHRIAEMLGPLIEMPPQKWPHFVTEPESGANFSVLPLPLGLRGEFGLLAAGARRTVFPEQSEKLVLEVAVNQAVIALHEARFVRKQKQLARELDERVARRTRELAAAEEGLRTEAEERRRAEVSLHDSERMSRLIVDSIPGMVALLAPTGEVETVNRQLLEYFGQTLEELRSWGSNNGTIHPEDISRVIETFTGAIASGRPYEIIQRFRRFDGVYRWFQNNGFPIQDASGQIVRWCVLLTDIDERKRAEEALKDSERNLKLIIDTIPALAWSARPDGRAEFFSQRYLDYIGLNGEAAADWGWIETVHPDDAENLAAVWRSLIASGDPGEAEARMRRHDGVYRWFLFRTSPLRDESGKIVKWYGTNTDIDDLKRAEESLRRSEAFLVEGQQLARMGNFFWCPATEELIWSEPLFRIFEFEPDAGISLEKIAIRVHPEDRSLLTDMIDRAARGVGDLQYEPRLLMPGGSIKHLHFVAHGSLNQRGRMEYIGAVQDVTERHLSEEALGEARSELARMTRIMSLGALTASITHEVNQPLSGILTNASTCLRMLDAAPPNIEGARETARRTIRDSNRASDVIKRLRALFAKKDFTLEPVDLNEATREVIALTRNQLLRNRTVLKTEFAEALPPAAGDRVQLQQVILNLLLNAIDAMNDTNDRPRTLIVKTQIDEGAVIRVSITDEGPGFDPEQAEKLFDAFYTTKSNGMGIGLSVSRSIIEKHQGRLWAESNEGAGAVFSFTIPALLRAAEAEYERSDSGSPADREN